MRLADFPPQWRPTGWFILPGEAVNISYTSDNAFESRG